MTERASKRTPLGKIAVALFWLFNGGMLIVTVLVLIGITNVLSNPPEGSELLPGAENAIFAAVVSLATLLFIWGFGAAMLAFFMYFTRPERG